ncbi:MAG: PD-(D/E)XK nuclease family transposase, partial [Bacteroidales bacterium]|nr:PD-(D/E)XK nuclease family transposase [Bacteroidales bacterium]
MATKKQMTSAASGEVYADNRKLSDEEKERYRKLYLSTCYEISHLPNEIDRFLGHEKDVTMDVLCKAASGREFIVEIQRRKRLSFNNRIVYYGASMIHAQLSRGKDYAQMCPVYVICFLDYITEHTEDRLLYRYSLLEESTGERYGDQLTLCVCELPRLKKQTMEGMDNLEVWLHLFNKMFTFAKEPESLPERFAPVLDAAKMLGLRKPEQNQYLQAMISQREREDI